MEIKNSKGKEYNYYEKLKLEGEYINGDRNDKGKEYYYNGGWKFVGVIFNWKKMEWKRIL